MKTLFVSTFLLIGSTILAQNVAATETNTLTPVKTYDKVEVKSAEKLIAATDKKRYYATLVRTVNVVKNEEKL